MITPILVTAGAVLVGAGLAAATSRDNLALGGLRSFAVAAVLAAVFVQLLPEAVAEIGASALVAFAVALVLPMLAGPALAMLRRATAAEGSALGTDIAFYGFVVHQWAEGLALGTLSSSDHGHGHLDIVFGIAAHTVPITAVFVSSALGSRGRRSAVVRTAALVLAAVAGFATADVVGATDLLSVQPWVSAFAAGFLMHVLLHGPDEQHRRAWISGPLDLLGCIAGASLPFLFGAAHGDDGGAVLAVRSELTHAFTELALETAPMLLLGLMLGAGLQLFGARIPSRFFTSGGALRQALRGIAVGAPLPLCACGVLPIAEALRRRGAGPALVMAFLVSTPELGPETLTLTLRFLGAPFAMVRLGAALLLAFVAAVAFARITRSRAGAPVTATPSDSEVAAPTPATARQAYEFFDELVLHTAPWTLVGLTAAAYVQVVIPSGSLASMAEYGLDVIVVGLVAMPTYVCAAAATPLAAVLLVKGVSPGAVLVGLLLGPATNIATIGVLRRGYGLRAVLLGVGVIAAVAYALGFAVNLSGIAPVVPEGLLQGHDHGPAAYAAAALLCIALLAQLWRWGVKPWLAILDTSSHQYHQHGHRGHGLPGHDHEGHDHEGHDHEGHDRHRHHHH